MTLSWVPCYACQWSVQKGLLSTKAQDNNQLTEKIGFRASKLAVWATLHRKQSLTALNRCGMLVIDYDLDLFSFYDD